MLRWGILLILGVSAPPAFAGPWVRQDNSFYSRIAVAHGSVETLNSTRIDAYSEFGLTDQWTLTLKYERVFFDDAGDFDADGWRATARRGFEIMPGVMASLEGGILQGAAIGGAAGCAALGAEARAGLGQSFDFTKKKIPMFWFAEGAVRAHDDGCLRRRIELGLGQQITPRILTISQLWFDAGTTNASSSKYQFEFLYRADEFDVSLGAFRELGGNFEESALFLALAKSF